MDVLLAGGAGFIGSNLTRYLLDRGHRVVVLDNVSTGSWSSVAALSGADADGRLTVMEADICCPIGLRIRVDAVIHLASPGSHVADFRQPLEAFEADTSGTRRLLEIARRDGARFLLASTSEVYGDPQEHPQRETYWGHVNPIGLRSVYDEAKRYAEALASAYARQHGVAVRIARIFNTYGPRMQLRDGRVIPAFVSQALRGEPLTVYGDGSQTRSFCYVDDLVAGLDALLWSDVQGPVNLGNPEEITILEAAERILRLTRSRSRIVHLPLPEDDPVRRRPDISRAEALLGWIPRTPFSAGLDPTVHDIARRVHSEWSPPLALSRIGLSANPVRVGPVAAAG